MDRYRSRDERSFRQSERSNRNLDEFRSSSSSQPPNRGNELAAVFTYSLNGTNYRYLQPGWYNPNGIEMNHQDPSLDELQDRMESVQQQLELLREEERRDMQDQMNALRNSDRQWDRSHPEHSQTFRHLSVASSKRRYDSPVQKRAKYRSSSKGIARREVSMRRRSRSRERKCTSFRDGRTEENRQTKERTRQKLRQSPEWGRSESIKQYHSGRRERALASLKTIPTSLSSKQRRKLCNTKTDDGCCESCDKRKILKHKLLEMVMNKKDIEDFLRRSNSISDQSPLEDAEIPIRRMSLKEFSGLDPSNKTQIAELSLTSWKKQSPASLINSYSARRRSVLSTEPTDSPTRRLSAPREETVDLSSAIDKVSGLRQTLAEASEPGASACNAEDGGYGERKRVLDDAKAFVATLKEIGEIKEGKYFDGAAELAETAESLLLSALIVINTGSFYQSRLMSTELDQVLSSLNDFLVEIRSVQDHVKPVLPARPFAHLLSVSNQLILAVTALN